jgi:hypothetical protein
MIENAGDEHTVIILPFSSARNRSKLFPRDTTNSCALGPEKLPIKEDKKRMNKI